MATTSDYRKNQLIPIIIIGVLFFIFGFITWLNGILIPYLKIACELTDFQAVFVVFSFYISYTIMAIPSSWVLKKTGFKQGMTLGLWIMAIGSLIFIPAAHQRAFSLFLLGLFIQGTGLAILQTASNPYITIIGPRESAARRLSIMGICNKVAGAIAPIVLAMFILHDGDEFLNQLVLLDENDRIIALNDLALRVINPYLVMTVALFFLGIFIKYSPLPLVEGEQDQDQDSSYSKQKKSIFEFPHLILGGIAIFFYVGIEVIAGDTIIQYGKTLGVPLESATYYTSLVLTAMVIGYFIGIILIPRYISQKSALIFSSILGLIFTICAAIIPQDLATSFTFISLKPFSKITMIIPYSVLFVAFLGLANALVWPAIWPLAIHDLGRFIKTGSAILIMGIAGGAVLPVIWGYLSHNFNSQEAYWIGIPCYLFILYYAVSGHKIRHWKKQ